jgi:hypothetical protein
MLMNANIYRDNRQEFWEHEFARALKYDAYLDNSPQRYADMWNAFEKQVPALEESQKTALNGHNRQLNILVSSGVWCGDCIRQGPMLKQICDQIDSPVDLRIVERGNSEMLQEELRILGALRVPMVVFLSEDFFEIGRFGDRMLTTYRRKARTELGPACSSGVVAPPDNELKCELAEWVEIFERMLLMARLSPPLRERYND